MGKIVAYARVSTGDQDPALQHDALEQAGAVRIFTDYASGATTSRPELSRCLEHLDAGDSLVVWKLDRLGRQTSSVIALIETLASRGVAFKSVTEPIDTDTPIGRALVSVLAAFSQMEREVLAERTRAGLAAARARGRVGGRPRVITDAQLEEARRMIDAGRTVTETARILGVGRTTLHRYLATAPVGA